MSHVMQALSKRGVGSYLTQLFCLYSSQFDPLFFALLPTKPDPEAGRLHGLDMVGKRAAPFRATSHFLGQNALHTRPQS